MSRKNANWLGPSRMPRATRSTPRATNVKDLGELVVRRGKGQPIDRLTLAREPPKVPTDWR